MFIAWITGDWRNLQNKRIKRTSRFERQNKTSRVKQSQKEEKVHHKRRKEWSFEINYNLTFSLTFFLSQCIKHENKHKEREGVRQICIWKHLKKVIIKKSERVKKVKDIKVLINYTCFFFFFFSRFLLLHFILFPRQMTICSQPKEGYSSLLQQTVIERYVVLSSCLFNITGHIR